MSQPTLFNAGQSANTLDNRGASKIPVGIHSKVTISSVELGENYLDINFVKTFEDGQNRVHNDRIWTPDKSRFQDNPNAGKTAEQVFVEACQNRVECITQYLKLVCTQEELGKITGATYDAFLKAAFPVLNSRLGGVLVNLKLIPKKGYSSIPNFPIYVEAYVEGNEPTLFYSKWEADQVSAMGNPPKNNNSVIDNSQKEQGPLF